MSARHCLTGLFAATLALGTLFPFSGIAAAKDSEVGPGIHQGQFVT